MIHATPSDILVTPTAVHFRARRMPRVIGRGGAVAPGVKREGDMASPTGLHHITGTLYRPDRMARPAPWARPILPGDLWSDDPRDAAYNTHVRAPHRFSHEALRRADPLYDLVLLTDWNTPEATPGRGSAIFVHRMRRPGYPTAGCLGLRVPDLRWLAARAVPGTRLIWR